MPEIAEIDIHDLILDDDVQEQEEPRRRERAKRQNVEYEVALSSGTDFAIRRKTQRTERLLVCLVSQEQYYIKDSDGSIKQLDVDNMTDFMSDLYDNDENGIRLPECSWTTMVPKGKKRCEVFLGYISNRQLMELAKNNLIMIDSYEYARYGAGAMRAFRMLTDMSRHHDARAMTSWCMGEMERKYGMTRSGSTRTGCTSKGTGASALLPRRTGMMRNEQVRPRGLLLGRRDVRGREQGEVHARGGYRDCQAGAWCLGHPP